jgi:hypothetical protein
MPRTLESPANTLPSKAWRFFYFGWMLKPLEGDQFSRAATRRGNRCTLQRWLPHYVRVHAGLAFLGGVAFVNYPASSAASTGHLLVALLFSAEACFALAAALAWAVLKVDRRFGEPGRSL